MSLKTLIAYLIGIINSEVIPVLLALAVVVFLYGGVRYIYKSRESKDITKDKDLLVWGLVALFVIFSVWGILALMKEALLP